MKKAASTILIFALLVSIVAGMTGCRRVPKDWYKSTLEFYGNGIKNGFTDEPRNLHVAEELKNSAYKKGYMLYDLDGDGTDELLIGLIDGGSYTKFTSIIVYHSDLGPYCLLSGGGGYYYYLCASNVIRGDSWRGSETETRYMTFNSKSNSFTIIDGEGKYMPMKWELTEF